MLSDFKGDPLVKKPRGVKAVSKAPSEVLRAKRALLRRAKVSERDFAKWLIKHDGADPRYRHLTSSTGRIGQIAGLQADAVSEHYLAECKNVIVPSTLAKWWQQICVKAGEWGKDPVLMWEPPNGSDWKVAGKPLPTMHIITAERHAELLSMEKYANKAERILDSLPVDMDDMLDDDDS